ncbi:MAG: transporter substrate-binding domain-containing protein, partial [Treponema sp.]|nr:transporter substrate-binding domain-containing protein [Treponema sp.]
QPNLVIANISFKDIPGVTANEINAIEALRTQYDSFVFGTNPATGAFIGKDGRIHGHTALFCDWLTEMFGIPFRIEFREWSALLEGFENGTIDFTDEVMPTPERRKTFFMTSPILQRSIKIFRLEGCLPFEYIVGSRPRYAFFEGSVLSADVSANAGYDFETIYVDSYSAAYRMLSNGEIDAYIGLDSSEAAFDEYGNVVSEDFYPLVFRSSCLSTKKPELAPVISVLEKALDERTLSYLTELYNAGYQEYLENKLYNLLTEEEKAYIQNNPVIPVVMEFDNYPVCFFDAHTNQWHGIFLDAMDEIAQLTGLTFIQANNQNAHPRELINMLENGEALIMPELFRYKEYEDRFLWSEVPLLSDTYAFLSRTDFRDIEINEIPYLTVGVRRNSAYYDFFKKLFPDHRHLIVYDTQKDVWDALQYGNIDLAFACKRRLILYTNFYEEAGYKLNVILNYSFDASFGYNRDAVVLRSIIDKALRIINLDTITDRWMHKSYDYQYKLAEARRPWLIGAAVSFFLVLVLVLTLFLRSRSTGKRLEILVKKRTKELSFKTSQLQLIIDSVPDLMFCKDIDYRYTQCNRHFENYLGVCEADIIGKADTDGAWIDPDSAENIYNIERKVMNENRVMKFEESVSAPVTGNKSFFETVKAPIIQDDVVVGMIGIARDITQRKAMEEEVRAALRAKTTFLANMSHEIRSPLNVIIGLTDLVLEDSNLSEYVSDNLIKISNAGSTLLSIVNDLLDFSKIEAGKLELTTVEYYMSSLLNDIITLVVTRLGEKPISFNLNISDDLPGKLYGDDLRVKQILTNLLSNSVKYTNKGTIDFSVQCTRDGDDVWMEAVVTDTGIGISEENLKKIFSEYSQVDTQANRRIEGTGLGLVITKSLVEMMDGKISAQSEYGKGSTFRLRIRQSFAGDTPIGHEIAEKLRSFRYIEDKRDITKKLVRHNLSYAKVLVVDDMQTNLDVAVGLLRKYKMQVDCAISGQEALDRIRQGSPVYNAIFMDHMMPGMDGIETADTIRALGTEYAKKIPIIALTANAIHGTEALFYEHDFQAFISKPIDIIELDSVIRKWVRSETHEETFDILPENENDKNIQIDIPGVDTKKGSSLYGRDMNIYLPLLRSYASNTPGVLNRLKSVSKATLPDYVIAVHGLKGTSAGIGAEMIQGTALNLETMSRAGNLDRVLAQNDKLIEDTEIVVANIKAWLDKYDANNAKPRLKSPSREVLSRLRQSCEKYDMNGIDKAMSELESADYEEDADLVAWLKEKISVSEIAEAAQRIARYEGVK